MVKEKMPVLFLGHGSPMNAIEKNKFTVNWGMISKQMPKPKAIVSISAHWIKEGSAVTAMDNPKTIHDFYGFPEALYKVSYSAKGSKEHVEQIKRAIKKVELGMDWEWGLDHGTWSVLTHMYPKADVPVLQLSLDYQLPLQKIFRIGREMGELRKKGVLILGSGNIVHNLMAMNPSAKPFDWAVEFDDFVKKSLAEMDYRSLMNYQEQKTAIISHPTNDHYLPLIYVMGAAENEKPQFFNEDIVFGSVGMRCVAFGMEKLKL